MGTSKRLAAHYDMRSQHQAILVAARDGGRPRPSIGDAPASWTFASGCEVSRLRRIGRLERLGSTWVLCVRSTGGQTRVA